LFHLRRCKSNVISTFSLFLCPSLSTSFSFLSIYGLIKLYLGLRTGRSLDLTDTHRHCPFSTIGNIFQIHPVSENEFISIARPIPLPVLGLNTLTLTVDPGPAHNRAKPNKLLHSAVIHKGLFQQPVSAGHLCVPKPFAPDNILPHSHSKHITSSVRRRINAHCGLKGVISANHISQSNAITGQIIVPTTL